MSSSEEKEEKKRRKAARAAEPTAAEAAAAAAAAEQEEEEQEEGGGGGAAARRAAFAAESAAASARQAAAAATAAAAAAAAAAAPAKKNYEFQFGPQAPPAVYEFTDASTNANIIAAIDDISIEDRVKQEALNHLSGDRLCQLLSTATPRIQKDIIDFLDYGGLSKIISSQAQIPPEILLQVHVRHKALLKGGIVRRRSRSGSPTNIAFRIKELFAHHAPGTRDTCFFKPVATSTVQAMCQTFPALQFLGLSQYTSFQSVTSEAQDLEYRQTNPVAILTRTETLTGKGGHFTAYIRAGTSWYNADNTYAVLRERTNGQPTWKTVEPKTKTKVTQMIYCYADTDRIPSMSVPPPPRALHGHPTFAQDGMGSCSVDALGSVLSFADGFRDIMELAANRTGINEIIVKHMNHARTKLQDVPACLAEVEALISTKLISPLSGPVWTEHRRPAPENLLLVSTAPAGSMFFSKEHRVPSGELLTRMIRYLAGTAIRLFFIRKEANLGPVKIGRNTSWGIQQLHGLKSLALSRRLKSTRTGHGMAVKATRKRSINRGKLYRATAARNRSRNRKSRRDQKIKEKRKGGTAPR